MHGYTLQQQQKLTKAAWHAISLSLSTDLRLTINLSPNNPQLCSQIILDSVSVPTHTLKRIRPFSRDNARHCPQRSTRWLGEIQPQLVWRSSRVASFATTGSSINVSVRSTRWSQNVRHMSSLLSGPVTWLTTTLADDGHACHEIAAVGTEETYTSSLDLLRHAAVVGPTAALTATMLHLLTCLTAGRGVNVDLAELNTVTGGGWNSRHFVTQSALYRNTLAVVIGCEATSTVTILGNYAILFNYCDLETVLIMYLFLFTLLFLLLINFHSWDKNVSLRCIGLFHHFLSQKFLFLFLGS